MEQQLQVTQINNQNVKEQMVNHDYIQFVEETISSTSDAEIMPNISTDKPFIQANTIASSLQEIKTGHLVPVFIKDNEPVISQSDFIEATLDVVSNIYATERILEPSVRLSHPIKGRIPEAKLKQANQLLENEKTLYYERMAFIIEIPSIHDAIGGNPLSLTVGGIKAYNLDNLYNRKGVDEHFKIFIGFQNKVCNNLCVWTDGFIDDLKIKNLGQLKASIQTMIENYNASYHLHFISKLNEYYLTEHQFAQLIGRCRMYNHLAIPMKNNITPLLLSDTQIGTVVKDFYKDNSFCRDKEGNINLWKLYNLFTGTNKSSYIDTFLPRSVNAFSFVNQVRLAMNNKTSNWFLS